MSIYKELQYDKILSEITGVQFSIMSEEDIYNDSVVEVTDNQTFQGNEPVPNGLFDPRMGVIDNNRVCSTCQEHNIFCPGHFGHIVMAKPVFYIQFFDIVRKLARCVCFRCSRILVDVESTEVQAVLSKRMPKQKRWEAISKLCMKAKKCGGEAVDGCGAKMPDKVVKTDDMKLKFVWKQPANEVVYDAQGILKIFRGISDTDCAVLGFTAQNHPKNMICTVLPVSPPAVRPSVKHDTGQRQEDHITHKLADIVKWNEKTKQMIEKGSTPEVLNDHVNMLQYHVATMVDNSVPNMFPSKDLTGRNFRSISERLRHKEGRVRGNLMGKRVDFSARTVITPDPNISIDELGIPLKIAMNLTFPEIVGTYNIQKLQRLVLNGPDTYPGAKQVVKKDEGNRTIRLRGHPNLASIVLAPGDVVERHLIQGDWVMFNRQPSLHKMSMMGHRVRVMPYDTFRLNPSVCPAFNADFDGDEMNCHVPQSLQTLYEIRQLAAVEHHIISPRYSRPIISIVQDTALGVYTITNPSTQLSECQVFNIICSTDNMEGFIGRMERRPAYSGRELLSMILPPIVNLNMRIGNKEPGDDGYDPNIHEVSVVNGEIKSGIITSKIYSKASQGIVHATYNTLGSKAVISLLNNTQRMVCKVLMDTGFSVGVSDLVMDESVLSEKRTKLSDAKREVMKLLQSVHQGTFNNLSTKTNSEFLEQSITTILSRGADAAGKITSGSVDHQKNRMLAMITSGSKGKPINFTQMTACLGGQSIENARVPNSFDGRTMVHFCKYDDGPDARGFVEHSFMEGLNPYEFFMHSMAGRIGLIDTAVRSVGWSTEVVIMQNGSGNCDCLPIGAWIDALMASFPDRVRWVDGDEPRVARMELLQLPNVVHIPTVDETGQVMWGLVTAVTRHDPTTRMYRMTTKMGRSVVVADTESLLVWKEQNQKASFVPTQTRDVVVGDRVPTILDLPSYGHGQLTYTYDDLALDYPNGYYLGLYLAYGSICEGVVIEAPDEATERWLSAWYDDRGYSPNCDAFTNFIRGIVGQGAAKHVPACCMTAPHGFLKGLLDGYGTGPIASERLAVQLGWLCALTCNTTCKTVVHERDAASRIWYVDDLQLETQHGVALDVVVSIEMVEDYAHAHDKVYDVTVPSTLNFVLANGLGVRDTSDTGYLQRRLVKAMEDNKVHHDRTVRNANDTIVQFSYGEDGMNSIKLENHSVPYLRMDSPADMREMYLITNAAQELSGYVKAAALNKALATDEAARTLHARCKEHFRQLVDDRHNIVVNFFRGLQVFDKAIVYPVHFQRIIEIVTNMYPSKISDLSPLEILEETDMLLDALIDMGPLGMLKEPEADVKRMYLWLPILMRCFLSPKVLICKHKLTRVAFDAIKERIMADYAAAFAIPGEMVGIVAAQSIGEPATQLTLNTFHLSGTNVSQVTSGVPRMKELLSSKNTKTPRMIIYLKPEWSGSVDKAQTVLASIKTTMLSDIVKKVETYFDPAIGNDHTPDACTGIPEDKGLVDFCSTYARYGAEATECDALLSPWVLRLTFDRAKMMDLQVTLLDVEDVLTSFYASTISCMFSDDNASTLIGRIRLVGFDPDNEDLLTEIKALEQSMMDSIVIKGIPHIRKAQLIPPSDALKRFDPMTDTFVANQEWTIETAGSNLIEVLGHYAVDARRTTTNDINEVMETLGLETARQVLINEIRLVLGDTDLDHRHLSILADTMCNRGYFMSIDRHGINTRGDPGPLAKSSFEQTADMLLNAGIFFERDNVSGVSANVMMGQVAPCGTGGSRIILDGNALEKYAPIMEATAKGKETDPDGGRRGAPVQPPIVANKRSDVRNVEADEITFD